jgi:hypothetical protein
MHLARRHTLSCAAARGADSAARCPYQQLKRFLIETFLSFEHLKFKLSGK